MQNLEPDTCGISLYFKPLLLVTEARSIHLKLFGFSYTRSSLYPRTKGRNLRRKWAGERRWKLETWKQITYFRMSYNFHELSSMATSAFRSLVTSADTSVLAKESLLTTWNFCIRALAAATVSSFHLSNLFSFLPFLPRFSPSFIAYWPGLRP